LFFGRLSKNWSSLVWNSVIAKFFEPNQSVNQSVHHTNQTNRSNTKLQEEQAPNSFLSFTVSNLYMCNSSSPCIPFFSFLGPFVLPFLFLGSVSCSETQRLALLSFQKPANGSPHHPLPISHFPTKKKHTKNKNKTKQKKELKFTCRELKFPMET
jgi:hypothetical protein